MKDSITAAITSTSELLRLELMTVRLRAALKEALEIAWRRGRDEFPPEDSDRLAVLEDYLQGRREGL